MNETQEAATRLRPFYGRIVVLESAVDETQLHSGLIRPHGFEGDDGVKRGVVQAVDRLHHEPLGSLEEIEAGTVVYYRNGVRLLDVVVVERSDILAYEHDPLAYEHDSRAGDH